MSTPIQSPSPNEPGRHFVTVWHRLCLAVAVIVLPVAASASSKGGGGAERPAAPAVATQKRVLQPPSGVAERIDGFRLSISQVSFPGVPERSACRLLVRAFNGGTRSVGLLLPVYTFNGAKEPLNSWLIPTAEVSPGQATERIYSCKMAHYLKLDLSAANGWPSVCMVGGEERSPCPVILNFEANLDLIEK